MSSLFYEIEVRLSKDDAQTAVIDLDSGNPVPDLSGYYEVLYDEEEEASETTELVFYFPLNIPEPDLSIHVYLSSLGIEDYTLKVRSVDREEYLKAYKDHYKPFVISKRIAVVPSWDKNTQREKEIIPPGGFPLYLDPGIAFGTGLHATTQLCLRYLDNSMRPGMRITDGGTGSGILAIGALLLGAGEVFAFDVDGNSVHAAAQNAKLNGVQDDRLTIVQGGFDIIPENKKKTDLLIANLTFNIIKSEKAGIDSVDSPIMVLSGVLENRLEDLKDLFRDRWILKESESLDGWICAVFHRA